MRNALWKQVFCFSHLLSLCFTFPGKAKTRESRQSIISPDWNFEKMGIGGLDKEFSDIFRRAFASRVFPPDIVEQMGEFSLSTSPSLIYVFVPALSLFPLSGFKFEDDFLRL